MTNPQPAEKSKKRIPPLENANPEPDHHTSQEESALLEMKLSFQQTEIDNLKQNIKLRKLYADRIYWLISLWLIGILYILLLNGFNMFGFKLSNSISVSLIGGTTINVIGLFAIVTKYLFNTGSKNEGTKTKTKKKK